MGWTAATTWTTGQVPTAANFNEQIRDNLNAMGDHTGWTTYAPALTGSVSNPNPAAKKGQYLRVGNLVLYSYHIQSGTTVGSGDYSVSLPVNGNMNNDLRCGSGYLYDASAYDAWTTVHYSSSTAATTVKIMWNGKTADGVVTHASPIAWASFDELAGQLIYRAAT
jgi:hypothetical protein